MEWNGVDAKWKQENIHYCFHGFGEVFQSEKEEENINNFVFHSFDSILFVSFGLKDQKV